MKISKKVSVAAILSAIACVLLSVGNFIETLTLSASALASLCVVVAVCELGYKYASLTYLTVSIIGFFLPVKDPTLYFVAFFGFYPIVKSLIEKIRSKVKLLLKGVAFSVSYAVIGFAVVKIFAEQADLFKWVIIAFPVFLATFFLYDLALTRLIIYYCRRLRFRLGIDKLLK